MDEVTQDTHKSTQGTHKTLVNCTGHDIHVYSSKRGNRIATIPPTGQIARIRVQSTIVDKAVVGGHVIEISQPTQHEITGLPDPIPGTLFLVSRSVAFAVKRPDVVHVGWRIRDRFDRLLGTDSFFKAPGTPSIVNVNQNTKEVK